jgi:hypothetical protein
LEERQSNPLAGLLADPGITYIDEFKGCLPVCSRVANEDVIFWGETL